MVPSRSLCCSLFQLNQQAMNFCGLSDLRRALDCIQIHRLTCR